MELKLNTLNLDEAAFLELAKRRREDRLYGHIEVPAHLARDLPVIRDLEDLINFTEHRINVHR